MSSTDEKLQKLRREAKTQRESASNAALEAAYKERELADAECAAHDHDYDSRGVCKRSEYHSLRDEAALSPLFRTLHDDRSISGEPYNPSGPEAARKFLHLVQGVPHVKELNKAATTLAAGGNWSTTLIATIRRMATELHAAREAFGTRATFPGPEAAFDYALALERARRLSPVRLQDARTEPAPVSPEPLIVPYSSLLPAVRAAAIGLRGYASPLDPIPVCLTCNNPVQFCVCGTNQTRTEPPAAPP